MEEEGRGNPQKKGKLRRQTQSLTLDRKRVTFLTQLDKRVFLLLRRHCGRVKKKDEGGAGAGGFHGVTAGHALLSHLC